MEKSNLTSDQAQSFYKEALDILKENQRPFMLGGAFAIACHTGLQRDTKDMDVFCKAEDYPGFLRDFEEKGFVTEITDSRWLAKVFEGDYFIDIIFNSPNNICHVDDSWLTHAVLADVMGRQVKFVAPEELIWCKTYVQSRYRYDGADILHIYLKQGRNLDWKRLFRRLDIHWQLLLSQLMIFQFVYPADFREIVPVWLLKDLLARLETQLSLPDPVRKVCLGPLIDQKQYSIDIEEWGYEVINI